jgi:hypothetical protein
VTKAQAEERLSRPVFGDPDCIKAVERLAAEPEVQRLRARLVGKFLQCGACGGTGDRCKLCGADGSIEITKELADSWELEILRDVYEEMGLES